MILYFEIGYKSWVCIHNCNDWQDAVNRLSYWWDVKSLRCLNSIDFEQLKENVVLTF